MVRVGDPLDFARRGQSLERVVSAGSLERLAEELSSAGRDAPVRYRLEGCLQGQKPFLLLDLAGDLVLTCQRCLSDVVCRIEASRRFLLVPEGEALPDDDLVDDLGEADFEPVHAERNLDVLALVEDEILLSLPTFPMHEQCAAPSGRGSEGKASPFAVLGQLKRGKK